MTTSYRLHYFPESGNSYKLALMLTMCGQRFDPIWTDFGGGITRTAEWRNSVNVMGEIPVLEENGVRLTQTAPILLRLVDRYGKFGGADSDQRQEVLRWLFWDNHKLTGTMASYRYMRSFIAEPDSTIMTFFRKRLDDYLGILENQLSRRSYVVGSTATVADISMIGYLMFPAEEAGFDFARTHPATRAWLDRIAALPGWKAPYDLLPGKRLKQYRSEQRATELSTT
jgi:glutathione S-transferase